MPYKSSNRYQRSIGKQVEVNRNQDLRTVSGLTQVNKWAPVDVDATGGTVSAPGNGFKYHTFKSSGSLVVTAVPGGHPGTCELLVVGGGGGSANGYYGGGGAGGVAKATFPLSVTTYPIAIGAASAPQATGNDTTVSGHPIGTITCKGGGRGGLFESHGGGAGGSGGGEQDTGEGVGPGTQPTQNPAWVPQPGFSQYGNPGGAGHMTGAYQSAGGGGAGAAGQGSSGGGGSGPYGKGGIGVEMPGFEYPLVDLGPLDPVSESNSPTYNHYGGGGGGWGYSVNPGGNAVVRAAGGGGPGQPAPTTGGPWGAPGKASQYLGGGGGLQPPGGEGGSGVVIFKIQKG